MDDPRFAAMHSKPTFKKIRKEKYEVQVDDRFKEMLTAEKFSLGPGEKKKKKPKKVEKKPVSDEEEEEEGDDEPSSTKAKSSQPLGSKKKPSEPVTKETRLEYLTRLARGEVDVSSSDSDGSGSDEEGDNSDSSSSDESDYGSDTEGRNPMEVEEDEVELIEDATNRLAIQNCEWSNVRAEDLMVILRSFCTSGMNIESVTVYPSDFGLERMEQEAIHGPPKALWEKPGSKVKQDSDDGSGSDSDGGSVEDTDFRGRTGDINKKKTFEEEEVDNVALRAYELSKLRYYFAIAVFDSPRTAEAIYSQLDGIEFEHSAMVFDMRFVPDDVSFADRPPRDISKATVGAAYKPPDFVVKALTHSNVECTWDKEDDAHRQNHLTNMSSWRTLNQSDLQQYLAESNSDDSDSRGNGSGSGSDDSDSEDSTARSKRKREQSKGMRALLLGGSDNDDGSAGSGEEVDDFFLQGSDDGSNNDNSLAKGKTKGGKGKINKHASMDEEEGEMGDMSFTFVPGQEQSAKEKEVQRRMEEGLETPQEAAARRKAARKAFKNGTSKENGGFESAPVREPATAAELSAIMRGSGSTGTGAGNDGDSEEDYDMHALTKAEKMRMKKSARLSKRKTNKAANEDVDEAAAAAEFAVNTTDERFFPKLRNSANFGIDPTSSEFKPTEGMNKILQEQRRLRQVEQDKEEAAMLRRAASATNGTGDADAEDTKRKRSADDVAPLVDRLKKKYKNK